MMCSQQVLKSSKKQGIFENRIIEKLEPFFIAQGYEVIPHARFNIAWGNIISDVDVLLMKGDKLAVIEVKSSHDNVNKAETQLKRIEDFVDEMFLACDFIPKKIPSKAGFILVNDNVSIVRNAKKVIKKPTFDSLILLHKSSLGKLLGLTKSEYNRMTKTNLVYLADSLDTKYLKSQLKEIVTCQG